MNPLLHPLARLSRHGHDDRGDVPGWVLVTVMTAGLCAALYGIANDQLSQLLTDALNKVK
ncbi:hypothetical protein [Nocardioides sp. CER19]|uniref:hypothetical protein n=1 Tax=Nocardioides sp. CER19 TaxID=3038538 RepID=UPI00244CD1CF|nr:hypothetical protein [Nocardioides sp. CER19]MDH2413957.1 hypothetical protein [Nocardioides sp. CER19]